MPPSGVVSPSLGRRPFLYRPGHHIGTNYKLLKRVGSFLGNKSNGRPPLDKQSSTSCQTQDNTSSCNLPLLESSHAAAPVVEALGSGQNKKDQHQRSPEAKIPFDLLRYFSYEGRRLTHSQEEGLPNCTSIINRPVLRAVNRRSIDPDNLSYYSCWKETGTIACKCLPHMK